MSNGSLKKLGIHFWRWRYVNGIATSLQPNHMHCIRHINFCYTKLQRYFLSKFQLSRISISSGENRKCAAEYTPRERPPSRSTPQQNIQRPFLYEEMNESLANIGQISVSCKNIDVRLVWPHDVIKQFGACMDVGVDAVIYWYNFFAISYPANFTRNKTALLNTCE